MISFKVDHATLNRRVIDYSPLIAAEAKKRKRPVASSWRMDETYGYQLKPGHALDLTVRPEPVEG
jgi:transposase-like protein